jgi:transposase
MAREAFPTPHDWKEGRRLRAWALAQQGWPQRTIAAALGVTEGAVSQWLKRGREGGITALRRRTSPGAPPKLSAAQRARVPALLARGAEAFGFRGDVWTAARIGWLLGARFGVWYHRSHVSRLMRALGWTPQKPLQRATQRDEAAIARWWAERWPRLKRGRSARGVPWSG